MQDGYFADEDQHNPASTSHFTHFSQHQAPQASVTSPEVLAVIPGSSSQALICSTQTS